MDFVSIFSDGVRGMLGPEAAIYALAAIGLNIHFGYTGLLNFGHVGFMLVGAYGVAVGVATFGWNLWVSILFGLFCSVVLALVLGIPTLRLRGDYLAIATIAAGEILRYFYRSSVAEPITGGVFGLRKFADEFYDLNVFPPGRYQFWVFDFTHRHLWIMVVVWGIVAIVSVLLLLLMRSPWGRVLRAVREDELAARSLGKNVYSFKMQSLVLGGALGALAGALLAINTQSVTPDTFNPVVTFYLWVVVILGGAARILGPIIGSIIFWFVVTFLDSFLRAATRNDVITWLESTDVGAMRLAVVGLGLMLLMIYRPAGLIGDVEEMRFHAR